MASSEYPCWFGDSDVDARYVVRALSPREAAAFEAHYFECDACFAAVQRALEIRAAYGAVGTGHARGVAMHARPAARGGWFRPALRARWGTLAAAGAIAAVLGTWRAMTSDSKGAAAGGVRPAHVERGASTLFPLWADATPSTVTAAWARRADAASYRVRLVNENGALLFERETPDTSVSIGVSSLAGLRSAGHAYWEVEALGPLRSVLARSLRAAELPAAAR